MIVNAGGGASGSSMTPYEYAVAGGYTGTEEEFQQMLSSGPYLEKNDYTKVWSQDDEMPNCISIGTFQPNWQNYDGWNNAGGWIFLNDSASIGNVYGVSYDYLKEFNLDSGLVAGNWSIQGYGGPSLFIGEGSCYAASTGCTTAILGSSNTIHAKNGYMLVFGDRNTTGFSYYEDKWVESRGTFDGNNNSFANTCIIGYKNAIYGDAVTTQDVILIGQGHSISNIYIHMVIVRSQVMPTYQIPLSWGMTV